MQQLLIRVAPADTDLVSGALFEAGAPGFEERSEAQGDCLIVYAKSLQELQSLRVALEAQLASGAQLERPLSFEFQELSEAYETQWLANLRPEWLTPKLVIQPASSAPPTGPARVIRYEPLMAFGTGSHPTTQLAARSIVNIVEQHQIRSVLDVGTGNGVLALVALVSGAEQALGLDIDPTAVEAALRNALLNGVASRARFEATSLEAITEGFELVVANIDAMTLARLAVALCARTQKVLLLTGFLKEQESEVEQKFIEHHMRISEHQEIDDWSLLCLEPELA